MQPLDILLIALVVVAIWAVVELGITLRKTRASIDEISHSATEVLDQCTPVIVKLDGVVDELQPALRDVPQMVDKLTVTVDEANMALGSVNGILGDVSSTTSGIAGVGESASRIVNTATSAAVGVVSKVASLGGINIPEGRALIEQPGETASAASETAPAVSVEPEPAAPRGGYVTYGAVKAEDAE